MAAVAAWLVAPGFAAVDGPAPNENTTGVALLAAGAVLAATDCGAADTSLAVNTGLDGDIVGPLAATAVGPSTPVADGESMPAAVGAAATGAAALMVRFILSVRCDAGLASIAVGEATVSAAGATPLLLCGEAVCALA